MLRCSRPNRLTVGERSDFMNRVLSCLVFLLVLTCVSVHAEEPGQSRATNHRQRVRRVLYNFDGDSCMFTRAGGKGPVAITVDNVKRLIEEVTFDGSQVDTVLVCINAQVMYYPTKVGTMRGTLSTPDERAKAFEERLVTDLNELPADLRARIEETGRQLAAGLPATPAG